MKVIPEFRLDDLVHRRHRPGSSIDRSQPTGPLPREGPLSLEGPRRREGPRVESWSRPTDVRSGPIVAGPGSVESGPGPVVAVVVGGRAQGVPQAGAPDGHGGQGLTHGLQGDRLGVDHVVGVDVPRGTLAVDVDLVALWVENGR